MRSRCPVAIYFGIRDPNYLLHHNIHLAQQQPANCRPAERHNTARPHYSALSTAVACRPLWCTAAVFVQKYCYTLQGFMASVFCCLYYPHDVVQLSTTFQVIQLEEHRTESVYDPLISAPTVELQHHPSRQYNWKQEKTRKIRWIILSSFKLTCMVL
jgi:hypothetical protein